MMDRNKYYALIKQTIQKAKEEQSIYDTREIAWAMARYAFESFKDYRTIVRENGTEPPSYSQFFDDVTKWEWNINRPSDMPELEKIK